MYGKVFITNSKEFLSNLTAQDELFLWSNLIGQVEFNQFITSPFRLDSHAGSCYIQAWNGRAIFIDWSNGDRYGIITAVKKLLGVSYYLAVTYSEAVLRGHSYSEFKNYNYVVEKSNIIKRDSKANLQYFSWTKKGKPAWSKQGKEYWLKRGLNSVDVSDIVDVHHITINDRPMLLKYPVFAYTFPNGNFKIYAPNEESNKKWFCTTNKEDIWKLGNSKNLIITKSRKDAGILHKLLPNWELWAFQNEGTIPNINLEDYDKKYCLYDNDMAGKKAAMDLSEYGCIPIFFQIEDGKDSEEVFLNKGKDYLLKYLNNLIC